LIIHLGKTHVSKGWGVYDASGKLDVDKTALATYRLYEARPRKPTDALIPNFPPFVALKHTEEFNDYIAKLTHVVNHAYKTKKTSENEHLWTAFDSANERVRIARAADHGPHLSKAAHAKLGTSMKIYNQTLGTNPVTGEKWYVHTNPSRSFPFEAVSGAVLDSRESNLTPELLPIHSIRK
jgi:hypothetical protein